MDRQDGRERGVRRLRRRRAVWLGVLLGPAAILLTAQWCCFPTTRSVRAMIEQADRVEIRKFFINHPQGGVDVAILDTPLERHRLAESIRITGWWQPFDILIGNSYRIRVIRGQQSTDLILRGCLLRSGRFWHAEIDDSVFATIRELSREQGRRWPTSQELLGKPATQPAGTGATSLPSDSDGRRLYE